MTHVERLELLQQLAKHIIAFTLVTGFLGIAFLAVLGIIDIKDPTTTGLLGVIFGAVGTRLDPALGSYYGRRRADEKPETTAVHDDRKEN